MSTSPGLLARTVRFSSTSRFGGYEGEVPQCGTSLSVSSSSRLRDVVSLTSMVASVNHCQRFASSMRLSNAVYWNRQKPPAGFGASVVVRAPPRSSQFGSTMPARSSPVKPWTGSASQRFSGTNTDGRPTEDQPPAGLSA